ncbi:hypothetical protein WICPIJ_009692 [Wickerhamomyces pijperi]|uniref:RNA helicase n=1 Tax=Wickerhamomyces pijperi TaxID=599730 RepID=A0A9P8PLG8_WICPI|nr:hypothetical protein WICPIJ_009692 [Wickerhamomyces pijperi]
MSNSKKVHTKFGEPSTEESTAANSAEVVQELDQDVQGQPSSSTNSKKRSRKRNKNKNGTGVTSEPTAAAASAASLESQPSIPETKKNKVFKFDVDEKKEEVTESNKIENTAEEESTQEKKPNDKEQVKPQRKKQKTHKVVEFFSDDEESNFRDTRGSNQPQQSLKQRASQLLSTRSNLPVYKSREQIMNHLNKNQVTILIGETGSGKSTQIPQFLLEQIPRDSKKQHKGIAVTQPRRVAAINLATRVAEEHGCPVGTAVGYSVRFDTTATHKTKLKYLTDGMLLRECILDPELSAYGVIIIDEAHERTVLTDLLMGFLKELLVKRNDLKLVIMSATLDAERFSKFFHSAEILFVEGRSYGVDRYYTKAACDDIVDSAIKSIVQLNQGEQEGDILVFLPGQEEIDKAVGILERLAPDLPKEAPLIVPFPLYASLSPADQAKVFLPLKARRRKVILATNIAETSVTVPGVRYVIDSGLRKVKLWRHSLGLSTLLTAPISKAAAMQRSGRAGREREGKVFRLYTESDYLKLPDQTEPEISRVNVTSPVLMLKELGVEDILNWSWLETPGEDSLISSLTQLYQLKALDDSGKITPLGHEMAILPLEPQLAAILIKSHREYHCLSDVIDIVSCLSVDNLVLNPSSETRDDVNERRRAVCGLGCRYGDLIMLKELLDCYLQFGNKDREERTQWCKDLALSSRGFRNVLKVRQQIRQYMMTLTKDKHLFQDIENDEEDDIEYGSKPMDIPAILKSFLTGHTTNTAIGLPDRSYRTTTNGSLIAIHPSSLLFGMKKDAIMFTDYVYTTRGYARNVSVVELEWLQEICGGVLKVNAANNEN